MTHQTLYYAVSLMFDKKNLAPYQKTWIISPKYQIGLNANTHIYVLGLMCALRAYFSLTDVCIRVPLTKAE